jgi:hypothetical protein
LPRAVCYLHALTRPELLSARRTNSVPTVQDPHGRHRDRRGARIHFLLAFIRLSTESDVRQTVSRNAYALALRRSVCQSSVGAHRRGQATRPRIRPGKYFVSFQTHLLTTHEQLVSQSLRFISTAIRSGAYRDIFESHDTIRGLIAGVVVPNLALRTRDVEAFEDTPLEYVRAELQVSEVATPRQAAADVVKALGGVGPDSESAATGVALEWIGRALAEASAARDGEDAWKSKNAAVYLFEAVATRSGTLAVRLSPILCVGCV